MDIGLWIASEYKDGVINKNLIDESANVMHPFTGIQVSDVRARVASATKSRRAGDSRFGP